MRLENEETDLAPLNVRFFSEKEREYRCLSTLQSAIVCRGVCVAPGVLEDADTSRVGRRLFPYVNAGAHVRARGGGGRLGEITLLPLRTLYAYRLLCFPPPSLLLFCFVVSDEVCGRKSVVTLPLPLSSFSRFREHLRGRRRALGGQCASYMGGDDDEKRHVFAIDLIFCPKRRERLSGRRAQHDTRVPVYTVSLSQTVLSFLVFLTLPSELRQRFFLV